MLELNLPKYDVKIIKRDGKEVIFDFLRRRYVALTPEEFVRQHFVHFLTDCLGYPRSLMANEVAINLNGMSRRCDTVLYKRDLLPQMIVEYKAPSVEISQKVFTQISQYNLVLKVDYLVVTNGLSHYCCKMDYSNQSYSFLSQIPPYEQL